MKNSLLIFLVTISLNCISQTKKVCDDKSEDLIDLNTISINKCNTEEKSNKKTRSVYKKKNNDRISHYIRDKERTKPKKTKINTQEVLFTIVDEIPLFPKCYNSKNKQCFSKKIVALFNKNFRPEEVFYNKVTKRIFIQFVVDVKGKIKNIKIKGVKKNKKLDEEVLRVIKKLPKLLPGKHKNLPVNVKYSFPLNFSTD